MKRVSERGDCEREGLKARSDRDLGGTLGLRQGSREGSLWAFEAETQCVRRSGAWEELEGRLRALRPCFSIIAHLEGVRFPRDSAFLRLPLDCGVSRPLSWTWLSIDAPDIGAVRLTGISS